MIFPGSPGLGREVQLLERETHFPFEHGEQASFDSAPDISCLPLTCGEYGNVGRCKIPR